MAQWWEHSPPTNVALLQIPATPYLGRVCCWFSPLLRGFFFRCALWFSPLLKNQHCKITIRPRIRHTRNHFVDVLPLNQYVFNIIFTVYFWIEVKYFMRNEQWIFYKNLSVLGQTLQRKNKVSTKDKQEPQHILKGKYSSKLGQSPLRKLHFRSNKKKLQVRKQIHTDRVHSS